MSFKLRDDVRYRMPVSFGPAIGPRQHPEGRMWTREETGTMSADWMTVRHRTDADRLDALLPPGFELRGDPVVAVSCGWFRELYWLAGGSYGILSVDIPVTYRGSAETLEGTFCPVLWEGRPEAIITGRDELGFPKLFGDFTEIAWDRDAGVASCSVSWLGHTFFDIALTDLTEDADPPRRLPGSDAGPALYYRYIPRVSPGGAEAADAVYVTTAAPPGSSGIAAQQIHFDEFELRRWAARGTLAWHRATFEQLPLYFPIVNALADLEIVEVLEAEIVSFSGPGIGIAGDGMRAVEPAEVLAPTA
jgi:hypothetical protein